MANGRKTPKAAASSGTPSTSRRQWPAEDESGGVGGAGGTSGNDDLVTIVRGLAAAVAEHNLSELVVDTPEVTFTIRRGVALTTTVAMQHPAQMVTQMAPPMQQMPQGMAAHMPHMPPPANVAAAIASAAPAYAAAVEDKGHVVTSPFVGTFYRKPNPDSSNYVKLGDRVKKNQVLCIVEAMKLMNEIEADIEGTIADILAEDGTSVEYGQPLFKIVP